MTSNHDPDRDPDVDHDPTSDPAPDPDVDPTPAPTPTPTGGVHELKRRGRPSKTRTCVQCSEPRMASEFRSAKATVCRRCAGENARANVKVTEILAKERVDKMRTEMLAMQQLPKAALALFTLPVCACCRDMRDVTADPLGGALLCPICLFQIVRCGRCATHASRDFYPQLTANPVVDVPAELLHAYGFKTTEELRREEEASTTVPVADGA